MKIKCHGYMPQRGGHAGKTSAAINHFSNTRAAQRALVARSFFRFIILQLRVPGSAERDGDEARMWAN
jgi:hypothetical protein